MGNNPKITFNDGKNDKTVDLYSDKGLDLVSDLWFKTFVYNKFTHDIKWMDVPIIQFPEDVVMMQELIWSVKPDIIIECGIAHGGSLIFYASLMELYGEGKVIGVDIEIREHNRKVIEKHQMFHRIELIEGSSISEHIINQLKNKIIDCKRVMVILDSNHSKEHVAKEIKIYKKMVSPGSYLVVMDGAQAYAWDMPNCKKEWKEDNPLTAIEEFMEKNKEFEIDMKYNRLKMTSNPKGFLRKLTEKEIKKMG